MEQTILKRSTNAQSICEEMLNTLCHKGNANQKDIEIPHFSGQNDCHQYHKQCQMLARMNVGGKAFLSLIYGNVN
jgi:hypothetical protein